MLFVMTQTGVATHAITHLEAHLTQSQNDDGDQNTSQEHCQQCVAHAQADTANIPATFALTLNQGQHLLATIPVAYLTSRLPALFSARAPPIA